MYGNKVTDCMNGIAATQANRGSSLRSGKPYLVQNLNVHDNTIAQATGIAAGILKRDVDDSIYMSWNNHYENNTYKLSDPSGKYYEWMNRLCTKAEWQDYGNDLNGKWLSKGNSLSPPNGLKVIK